MQRKGMVGMAGLWVVLTVIMGWCQASWLSSSAQAGDGLSVFGHPDCPFSFQLPASASLDASGIEVTRWPDGARMVGATWNVGDAHIIVACTPQEGFRIPKGFLPGICNSDNPNLTEGSHCAAAKSYDGVEVYYQRRSAGAAVPYFWVYIGLKEGRGRITLRVGYEGKNEPDAKLVGTVTSVAKALFETVR